MPMVQDVGSKFIGKLILLDGLVVKRSEINPKVQVGFYKCTYCNATYRLRIGRDDVPELCPQCKRRSLKQDSEESQFINLQKISVQDPLEKLKGSAPTWQLEVWIEDDLVNTILPGDRIDITGILQHKAEKKHTRQAGEESLLNVPRTVSVLPKQRNSQTYR